jgi:AraC-like DNA-binding protein
MPRQVAPAVSLPPGVPRQAAYVEWPAHPALAAHVVCTWQDAPSPRRQPVLPDACIDLVWDGATVLVAGPDTHAAAPTNGDDTFVGIRFRPGAAPGYLGVAASELLDSRVPLRDLWGPSADTLTQLLMDEPSFAASTLEAALLSRLEMANCADPLVEATVRALSVARSRPATVTALATSFGVSERTLRRRCADALGYGPKTLDRILRFRRALRLLRHQHPLADAARLAGYADQAHLTNECRRLADSTPADVSNSPEVTLSGNGYN